MRSGPRTRTGSGRRVAAMAVARIVNAVLQLVVTILISRALDASALGEFFTVVAIGAVAAGFTGLGLATRALRLGSEASPGSAAAMVATGALGNVAAAAIAVATGMAIMGYRLDVVVAGAIFAIAETYTSLCVNVLLGQDRQRRAIAALVVRRVVATAAIALSLLTPQIPMLTAVSVGFGGAIVVTQALVGRLPWHGLAFAATVRSSLHFWHSSVWSTAQQADVIIVSAIAGTEASGIYALAARLTAPAHLITGSIVQVMVPALTRARTTTPGGDHADALARPYARAGWAYTGMLVAGAPLAAWIAPHVTADTTGNLGMLVAVFTLARAVSVSSQIDGGRLVARHRERDVATVNAVSTALSLAAVAAVAPLGPVWPAAAFLASRVYARAHLWVTMRRPGPRPPPGGGTADAP